MLPLADDNVNVNVTGEKKESTRWPTNVNVRLEFGHERFFQQIWEKISLTNWLFVELAKWQIATHNAALLLLFLGPS